MQLSYRVKRPKRRVWANKKTLSHMLGISPHTIDKLVGEGMPVIVLSERTVRFDVEDVRKFLRKEYGSL